MQQSLQPEALRFAIVGTWTSQQVGAFELLAVLQKDAAFHCQLHMMHAKA